MMEQKRLLGLDAFRGFVILAMVFVNYIGGMKGIPAMLEHAPGGVDHFTLADLVFPAFLLMVGVSIPLAMSKRIERGEPFSTTTGHIFSRTAALLVMGVVLVDPWAYDAAATGVPAYVWFPLFYLSAGLFLFDAAPFRRFNSTAFLRTIRIIALLGVVTLLAISRLDYQDGLGPGPLRTSWWGILGMIGWCYLPNAILWNFFARLRKCLHATCSLLDVLIALLVLEIVFYTMWHSGMMPWIDNGFLNLPVLFGSHAALVTSGMIAGQLVLERKSTRKMHLNWLLFSAILYGAGWMLRHWQIANKIDGTASWTLMTGGIALLGMTLFSAWGETKTAPAIRWMVPIGANAMLAYLLPDFFGKLMDASALALVPAVGGDSSSWLNLWNIFWPFWNTGGVAGLANALVMTLLIGGVAAVLSKKKIRLKL